MNAFELSVLIQPAALIFCVTFAVGFYVLRNPGAAIVVASLKTFIYIIYFGWIFDGSITFSDDWSYLYRGQVLYSAGIRFFNVFDIIQYWDFMRNVAGGEHFIYYLYNCYAIGLFGYGYYAPVALNIVLTAVIALLGVKIVSKEFRLSRSLANLFFLFLLFHPDIVAWSSITNLKDTLVLTLHVIFLYGISCFFNNRYRTAFTAISISIVILLQIRFYVPLMFLAAFILLISIQKKKYQKQVVRKIIIGGVTILVALFVFSPATVSYAITMIQSHYSQPIYGLIRFLLTPIPFNTEYNYRFLNIPAILHWLFLPFMLIGINFIFKYNTSFTRYLIIYFILFTLLYAFFEELQGPRHRVQMDFIIALSQFLGFYKIFRRKPTSEIIY